MIRNPVAAVGVGAGHQGNAYVLNPETRQYHQQYAPSYIVQQEEYIKGSGPAGFNPSALPRY